MAGNFVRGLELLAEAGEVSLDSPFMRSLLDGLTRLMGATVTSPPQITIEAVPESNWERQIAEAVELSFGPAVLELNSNR